MEPSTVSQWLQQLLNKVDLDIECAIYNTWVSKSFILVSERREESEDERLKGVRLEAVQAAAARHTLDEIFSLWINAEIVEVGMVQKINKFLIRYTQYVHYTNT